MSPHRTAIDGLRALAFLGVFFYHANSLRFPAGSLGVPVFFALSGFLITRILAKNEGPSIAGDLRTFYIRRTLRIFPLYYASLIVLQLLGKLEQPWSSYLYVYNIATYARGELIGIHGHFWTLSVEEQFYLVFPVLFLATPKAFRSAMLLTLWLACALSRHLMERYAPSPFLGMLPNVAGEYLVAGAIAGMVDLRNPGAKSCPWKLATSLAGSAWVALWVGGRPIGQFLGPFVPDVAALAFATLVLEVWRSEGRMAGALSWRPLAFVGTISYGCYVFHLFALDFAGWALIQLGAPMHSAAWRAIRIPSAFAATIGLAWLSWHSLEAPILRLKSRFEYDRPIPKPARMAVSAATRPDTVPA